MLGFGDLCRQDREVLFQSSSLELFTLRLAYRYYQNYTFSGLDRPRGLKDNIVLLRNVLKYLSILFLQVGITSYFYIVLKSGFRSRSREPLGAVFYRKLEPGAGAVKIGRLPAP